MHASPQSTASCTSTNAAVLQAHDDKVSQTAGAPQPDSAPIAADPAPVASELLTSRRTMLGTLTAVTAGALLGKNAVASCGTSVVASCTCPGTPDYWAVNLANKATFGYTPEVLDCICSSYNGWLYEQLYFQSDPVAYQNLYDAWEDFECQMVSEYPLLAQTQQDWFMNGAGNSNYARELIEARIRRAIESPAQLLERTVEFWTDHFNVPLNGIALNPSKIIDDNMIRENAHGSLSTLLLGSALSPAMLAYLNGDKNTKNSVNENYARELLELHTLGVNNGYDQNTINQLALALTGWYIDSSNHTHEVKFDVNRHYSGSSLVIKFPLDPSDPDISHLTLNSNDEYELDLTNISKSKRVAEVVGALTDPSKLGKKTARYVGMKLARHFLGYDADTIVMPSRGPIDDVIVDTYAQSSTNNIAAMLAEILSEEAMKQATPKLKRPLHLLASTCRAFNPWMPIYYFNGQIAGSSTPSQINTYFLSPAGHSPFGWPAPNGYPDTAEFWSALFHRWSFGARISSSQLTIGSVLGRYGHVKIDVSAADSTSTPQDTFDYFERLMLAGGFTQDERETIVDYIAELNADPSNCYSDEYKKRMMLGLMIGAPSFQWY